MNLSKSWTKFFFCIMNSAPFFMASSVMPSSELITTTVVFRDVFLKNRQISKPSLFVSLNWSRFMSRNAISGFAVFGPYAVMMLSFVPKYFVLL